MAGVGLDPGHPSDVVLADAERAHRVRDHLAACAPCRVRARQLGAFLSQADGEPDGPSPTWSDEPVSASIGSVGVGAVLDGRYLVEDRIGHGGFGVVYRVRHLQLDTLHALKVLRLDGTAVQDRLLREGRLQARLDHPNVVRVTDVVRVGAQLGLVMDHVAGPTLAEALAAGTLGGWPARVRVAIGLVQGVAAAHRAGFVHRDLKPANVLLADGPDGVVPRVADFGLARWLHSAEASLTRPGAVLGTPAYMAPEQFEDARSVDARADVFAVGAILYELATGERAFGGETLAEVRAAIVGGRFVPVRQRAPDVPPALARAIEGALVVDRSRRSADGDAVLARLTEGEAARAPTGRTSRVALVGAGLGGLAVAVAVAWWTSLPSSPASPVSGVPAIAAAPAAVARPDAVEDAVPSPDAVPSSDAVPSPVVVPSPPSRALPPPPPVPALPVPAPPVPAPPAPAPLPARASAAPAPAAPAALPEPTPPPPEPGRVEVMGERRPALSLRRGELEAAPDRVPPGRWALYADFGDGPLRVGDVTVDAGERVVVRCNGMKRQCDVAR